MKLKILLAAFILFSFSAAGFQPLQNQKRVAVISLSGPIQPSSGGLGGETISPEGVRDKTGKALEKNPEAVIYEFNSGGGAVVASKEVMRAIERVERPTVCRIRDIGASGAYLSSLGCDRIVADSSSLTGSIGVRASYLEFSGLLERLGVEYVNITAGEYKDVGSPYQNISEEERKLLESKINRIHDDFLGLVEDKRNLTGDELEKVSTGDAFLGEKAMELGLVDRTGGRDTAVSVAENMTGKNLKIDVVEDRPEFSFLEIFFSDLSLDLRKSAPFGLVY